MGNEVPRGSESSYLQIQRLVSLNYNIIIHESSRNFTSQKGYLTFVVTIVTYTVLVRFETGKKSGSESVVDQATYSKSRTFVLSPSEPDILLIFSGISF